jgi:hypothetical protein
VAAAHHDQLEGFGGRDGVIAAVALELHSLKLGGGGAASSTRPWPSFQCCQNLRAEVRHPGLTARLPQISIGAMGGDPMLGP